MKSRFVIVSALLLLVLPLWAQDKAGDQDYFGGLHKKGSQLISLSTGANIPLFILPADPDPTEVTPLNVGASFSLSYQYFVANRVSLGGSLTGAFNGTVGGRSLFLAPIAAHVGYWWGKTPMEYTVGLDAGMNIMRLSGDGMITPFAKLGVGVFHQIGNAWSLGGQTYWWFIPEIHTGTYSDLTRYGNFLEISVSAVYHF